ncbi:MAG: hypothetical protein A2X92_00990 [Syntrophus sp. GWC2_56_31]|nr:MAG: hypothetical protein A2X92_00990 [Syntrophus sp. GWC2_56_31]
MKDKSLKNPGLVEEISALKQRIKEPEPSESEHKPAEEEKHLNMGEARRSAEEMAIIAEIGRVISSSLDIDEVYESFVTEARKLIPSDRISVTVINPDGKSFTNAYVSGFDIPERRPGTIAPIAGSVSEIFMKKRSGLIIHVEDPEDFVKRLPGVTVSLVVRAGIRSMIGVPMISRGKLIGVLHFRAIRPNAYTEQDLRLAERIGDQIAGAIANARLFLECKQAEESLQWVNDQLEQRVVERTSELLRVNEELRTEITVRKRVEEALRGSEQLLQSYIDGAGDAIYAVETDTGRILNCNLRACLDLGYSRDELLKLSAKDIETGFSSDQIDAFHFDVKQKGVKTFEGMHKRKDGSVFPVEIRLSLISSAQPGLMISIVRDITARKQAEEELERYRLSLEEMVKERTAELEIKNVTLQELNTTLKVLLKQREEDKQDMEERFVMNVHSLVLPFVEQMKKGRLDVGQQPRLEIVETHLRDITMPLLKNIRKFNLTPKELKVAALVRNGKSTKEIAEILAVAAGSIDVHRNNIRKKLGLNSRRTNLQSYLETLA